MNKVDEIREALVWLVELRAHRFFEGKKFVGEEFSKFWKTFRPTEKLEKNSRNGKRQVVVAISASECVGDFALSVEIDSALDALCRWKEQTTLAVQEYIRRAGHTLSSVNLRDEFPSQLEQLESLIDRFRKIIRFLPDSRDPFERHCDRMEEHTHREIAMRWKELNPADSRSLVQIKRASENYTRKKLSQTFSSPTKKPTKSKKVKKS